MILPVALFVLLSRWKWIVELEIYFIVLEGVIQLRWMDIKWIISFFLNFKYDGYIAEN